MTNLAEVPTGFALESNAVPWTRIGPVDAMPYDRGFAVLIEDTPVAVFRLSAIDGQSEEWHAVSHIDPVAGVPVMARGLIGSREPDPGDPDSGDPDLGEPDLGEPKPGEPGFGMFATVASPLHKRRYDLATGRCVDDDSPPLTVFEILIVDKQVLVR